MEVNTYNYKYPRPALTTDCVLLRLFRDDLKVLLIQRKNPPFKGSWAFPGGFVEESETVEQCALRELQEETLLSNLELYQFHTFSAPQRDPRGWTVTVAFFSCVCRDLEQEAVGNDDAAQAQWFSLKALPKLAFDHQKILEKAIEEIQRRMITEPLAFSFLNHIFTFEDADVLLSNLYGLDADTFAWLEMLKQKNLIIVHNVDIPSYMFNYKEFEVLLTKGIVKLI